MESSLDLLRCAAEARTRAARAWFPSQRRRLLRQADDLERASLVALRVETIEAHREAQRAAKPAVA